MPDSRSGKTVDVSDPTGAAPSSSQSPPQSAGAPPGASSTAADGLQPKTPFSNMTPEQVKAWIEKQAKGVENRYAGLERALREQLIAEGVLPPSALWEDQKDDPSTTIQLDTTEEFDRAFTEASLGLALNVGKRGTIIVKRCVPGSPSASRRIPPGVVLTHVNDAKLEFLSLKEVQGMLQAAERPVKLHFRQTEASLALAHESLRNVAAERDEHARKLAESKSKFEDEMRPAETETAEVFTRTYAEARLGLCLVDGASEGRRRTLVRKTLPRTPAWKSGLPENVCITAINGKSVEFRRFKEVKKLIELAQRPVTLSFSMEDARNGWPRLREGFPTSLL